MPHYKVGLDDGSTMQFDSDQLLNPKQLQDVVSQNHPAAQTKPQPFGQKAYSFAQETVPYVAGGLAGAAGAPFGPEAAIPAAGVGYSGAKLGLRQLGQKLGYEKPQDTRSQFNQTYLNDLPAGMGMEMAPQALGKIGEMIGPTLGRVGKGASEIAGAATGVDPERFQSIFKNPRTMLPEWMGGPPPIREAGAAQGAAEARLGVPRIEDKPLETIYQQRAPKKISISDPERETYMLGNLKPSNEYSARAIKELANESGVTDQEMALKVHQKMMSGESPTTQEAVQALRGVDKSLDVLPTSRANMTKEQLENHLLLTRQRTKLQQIINASAPDLAKARADYAGAATRQDMISPAGGLLPKTGSDKVAGIYRTIGPYALSRAAHNPVLALPFYALQSPLATGSLTAGLGGLAKAAGSEAVQRGGATLADILRRRRQLENSDSQ